MSVTAHGGERRAGGPRPVDVVTEPERRRLYLERGLWDDDTVLSRFLGHAARRPEEVAVVDERDRMTYGELDRASAGVAAHLAALGVRPGDVVSIQLPNWAEAVAVALGVARAGAVAHTLLPLYRERELRYTLGLVRAKVLYTPASYRGFEFAPMIDSLRGDLPELTAHVVARGSGGDASLEPILAGEAAAAEPGPPLRAADVSLLIFTSGTEAEPKAIMHTDQTVGFSARAAYAALDLGPDDVVWMPSPVGHSTGFNYGLRFALYHGLKLVLQDRWDPVRAAESIERERATYTLAATTFLRDLVADRDATERDLSSMTRFGCGGAPVPAELVDAAAAVGIGALRLYGSTEVLVATWNRVGSSPRQRRHTEGPPVHESVELAVVDAEDRAARPGGEGELLVRGPNTCVGFFEDPGRTAATFRPGGWIRSGDLGVIDGDGCFTISGRKKEIIIRGGLNITPREIEDLLIATEPVVAAAVVGIPDERLGELACACVTLAAGASLDFDRMVGELSAAGLAKHKLPQRLAILERLPMTASGKVQKHVLRARIAEGTVAVTRPGTAAGEKEG